MLVGGGCTSLERVGRSGVGYAKAVGAVARVGFRMMILVRGEEVL